MFIEFTCRTEDKPRWGKETLNFSKLNSVSCGMIHQTTEVLSAGKLTYYVEVSHKVKEDQ
jgi:hypothetical protein